MAMPARPDNARDSVVTAFLRSIPPERREELRALLLAGREKGGEWDTASDDVDTFPFGALDMDDLDDDVDLAGDDGQETPSGPSRSPLPAMSRDDRYAADAVTLAAMRSVGNAFLVEASASPAAREPAQQPERKPPGFVVRLSDIEPERVRWLSPGRLAAGKITVLDGDPGLGKSTLLCELAARITRGEALPGGDAAAPRAVVLLSAEDDLRDTIRPRIDVAGGDARRVVSFVAVPDGSAAGRPFVIPGDVSLLETVVQRVDAALVIVDPLVAFLDGGLSANSDQDVRRALVALKVVGENTGAAIVVVRHLNKSSGTNPLYRGGGSIGIIGAARCGLVLAADPDDAERRVLAATKGNLARPPAALAFRLETAPGADVARVVWEGETRWTAAELLRAADDGEEQRSAMGEARAWLRETLADGPRPAKAMQAEAAARGVSERTLKRARQTEGVVARKERGPNGGWLWSTSSEREEGGHPLPLGLLGPLGPLPQDARTAATDAMTTEEAVSARTSRAETEIAPWERTCITCGAALGPDQTDRRAPCLHCGTIAER